MTPMNAARKEFLAEWIKYGAKLFNRAEAHGVEWRRMPIQNVPAAVDFAEEFAKPDPRSFQDFFPINQ
jgi:hypothetical protein